MNTYTLGIDGAARGNLPTQDQAALNLWCSVLHHACDEYVGIGVLVYSTPKALEEQKELLRRRAAHYFKSDETGVGSFVWICDLLNMDPEKTLANILAGNYQKFGKGAWLENRKIRGEEGDDE